SPGLGQVTPNLVVNEVNLTDSPSLWEILGRLVSLWWTPQTTPESALGGTLSLAGVQEMWVKILVLALVLLALFFSWNSLRGLPSRIRRLQILFLRLLALVALVLMIFEPQLEMEESVRVKNAVAILLDYSRSMSFQDKGESRLEAVRKFLSSNANFLSSLEKDFEVDYFTFSDKLEEAGKDTIETAKTPEGSATDLAVVLRELKKRYQNKPTSAFLLFSDGADTSRLPKSQRLEELELMAQNLPAPLYTFSPSPVPYRDISITGINYDNFAFIRNPWRLEVKVKVKGYEDLTIPVLLKEGENILLSRALKLQKGVEEYTVSMEATPHTVGDHLYIITIPPMSDELVRENNTVSLMVQVIRDKIRVLHLCGRPSWDEIFLRRILKRDPSIDLISFFILRTPGDLVEASGRELSLIPFPAEELFTKALESFDLVIFQNFDYRPYDATMFRFGYYLSNVERYVRQGEGSFLMIGGDLSFSNGGYDGTPVEDILPVELEEGSDTIDIKNFKSQLTPQGLTHPITSLDYDPERNRKLWEGMPELKGCNRVRALKRGAVALSVYPDSTIPVLAVQEAGKGRVMALLTDDSWRWNFLSIARGGSNRNYIKFWRNAVRWLVKDPELNLVRITTDKKEYLPEEEVHIKAEVLGKDYKPLPGAKMELTVVRSETGEKALEKTLESNEAGCAYLSYKPQEGYYYVKAKVQQGEGEKPDVRAYGHTPLQEASTLFGVVPALEEFREPWIEESFLEKTAAASGGKYFKLPVAELEKALSIKNPLVMRPIGKKTFPLWDNWLLFSIILGALSTEWWLRKGAGIK
ncbi:MAG TPA: glutamine amidotransferase, partial [Candidatus Hypogeohydataceae bacterium YC41]